MPLTYQDKCCRAYVAYGYLHTWRAVAEALGCSTMTALRRAQAYGDAQRLVWPPKKLPKRTPDQLPWETDYGKSLKGPIH